MRFLIREQEYEVPLAAGRFVHGAGGAVEAWRLTAAEEYRILRVDLDERGTARDATTLFHFLLTAGWQPERLTYRAFGDRREASGTVIAQGGRFLHSVDERDGERVAEVEEVDFGLAEEQPRLWFPAALGRAMVMVGLVVPAEGLTVNSAALAVAGDGHGFTLAWAGLRLRPGGPDEVEVGRRSIAAQQVALTAAAEEWTMWLDGWQLPVRLAAAEGAAAAETQYIRYEENLRRYLAPGE